MLELIDVNMKFSKKEVLKNISFKVDRGDFIGVIGKNGSGKTTLVNLIIGTIKPISGEIKRDYQKEEVGLQIQDVLFLPESTANDYIKLYADLYNISKTKSQKLIATVGVDEFLNVKIKKLSGGQRQRINILLAILHDPELIIFDELTTGLDALSRYDVRNILKNLNGHGKTIILVSHYMEEVEYLCNKVLFLKDGKVKVYGNIENLLKKFEIKSLDDYFKGEVAET